MIGRIGFLVLVVSLPGYAQVKISELFPSWSPSGTEIAFCSNIDGDYDIYVSDSDGENIRRVTDNTFDDFWPTWLGDTALVFDSNMHGNEEIYRVNKNGSGLVRLTFDTAAYDGVASVSKLNGLISFDSNRGSDKLADVWIMRADGDMQTQMTTRDLSFGHPAWSADGQKIIFKGRLQENVQEIFEMRVSGSEIRQLTTMGVLSMHPSWSPDDRMIAFTAKVDGDFDLHVMEVATSHVKRILENEYDDSRPSFSPDGETILFASKTLSGWRICTMKLTTGTVTILRNPQTKAASK
jgi:TolB protein